MNQTGSKEKVLIITGGQVEEEFIKRLVMKEEYTKIIVADRGLVVADRLQLPLDYIVGDFDSVPDAILRKYKETSTPIKTFPKEKDKTDTQIAIELALMHSPADLDIAGATGSRLDHALANLHLLLLPLHLNVNAHIIDENNKIYLKKESFSIKKSEQYGNYVSLLPFTWTVNRLSLKGFKYPLNSIILTAGSSLGISNEIKEDEAFVEFRDGILVVDESKD